MKINVDSKPYKFVLASARLVGLSPISFGKYHKPEKLKGENDKQWEERTWREKMHQTAEGEVVIPAFGLKNMMATAAKRLGIKVTGKRGSLYGKVFQSGLLVSKSPGLGVRAADVSYTDLMVTVGAASTNRVIRRFPFIPTWSCTVEFELLDPLISADIFSEHLVYAGCFIGLGTLRVENGGTFGRFKIASLDWTEA